MLLHAIVVVRHQCFVAHADESLRVNLDNLLIQLRPQVGPRWYQFGEAVGISKDVLDKFVKQCSPEDCIIEMLDYWLRSSTKQPTWNDIAKILKAVNLPQLAHDIENVYSTGIIIIVITIMKYLTGINACRQTTD